MSTSNNRFLFFVPLLLLTLACGYFSRVSLPTPAPVNATAPGPPPTIEVPSFTIGTQVPPVMGEDGLWVLFAGNKAQDSYAEYDFSENFEGYWSPSVEDIVDMETHLGDFLQQNADEFFRHPTVWEQLDEYHRQYVGVIVDGKQLIHGNFFCSEISLDWTQEWVIVMDGGDCFFTTLYDVESETYIRLQVNGEA